LIYENMKTINEFMKNLHICEKYVKKSVDLLLVDSIKLL